MASAQSEEVKVEENNTGGFYERFVALPVVSEAITQTTAVYNAVKHTHPLAEYACDTGESVVKRVTETAYNVGTPIAGIALKAAKPLVGNDPGEYKLVPRAVSGQNILRTKRSSLLPIGEHINIQDNDKYILQMFRASNVL